MKIVMIRVLIVYRIGSEFDAELWQTLHVKTKLEPKDASLIRKYVGKSS